MSVEFRWNGPAVLAEMRARLAPRVQEAAEIVAERARLTCPVKTGALRESIAVQPTDDPLTAEIVVAAEYAPYVEIGTSRTPAQPFLFPAFAESTSDVGHKLARG